MMRCWSKAAFSVMLITSLSACGQDTQATSNYVKSHEWSSICLARIGLDLPDRVLVADPGASYSSGGGFEGIAGTFTNSPQINAIRIEETGPTTQQNFKDVRDLASFRNVNGRITRHAEA